MLDLDDKGFLKSLRMLRIVTRRFFRGQKVGQRKSQRKGASVEFKDYKEYQPGDDPRFLDWNVYGRFDKLLVKLFHNEEDLQVFVLVDSSASMQFGSPSKYDHARRLAAAISYLAASGLDRSLVMTFADGLSRLSTPASRPGHVFHHFRFLEKAEGGGPSRLEKSVDEFLSRTKRKGAVFVVSDFLTEGVQEALRKLRFNRHEVFLIQVLSEEEQVPTLAGLVQLVDSETGNQRELYMDAAAIEAYRQVLEEFTGGLESFALGQGITYVKSSTSAPFQSTILQLFAPRGRS